MQAGSANAPVSEGLAIERIARVLAGWEASSNADGSSASASPEVEADWPDHVDQARAILKTLREPDRAMAAAGDADIWSRMVDAAIAGHGQIDLPSSEAPAPPPVRNAHSASEPAWEEEDARSDESFPASDPPPANPGIA